MPSFVTTPKSTNCVKYLQHNPKLQFSLHPTETSLRKWHLGAISLARDWTAELPASGNNAAARARGVRLPGQTIQGLWNKEKSPKEQDSPELGARPLPSCLARKTEVYSSIVGMHFPGLAQYVPQDACASVFMSAFTAYNSKILGKTPYCPLMGSV